ncbi:nectin-4 isoform X2 [Nerophis lumbriciformis]|uniref:nectin-4 isoform X2 n=1 Tax=Nerophis lumbriciformis TaxID=546530 RepID=UPI002ADFF168|nr:nectin-4-like isoform X2 [Nerophis lumbriciformis]
MDQSVLGWILGCLLRLLLSVACAQGVFIEPLKSVTWQRSMAESTTRLPCRYQPLVGEKVVQVTWYKELRGGTKDQITTAHFADGHTEFGRYSGRVRFESSSPTMNSALLIPNTEESDDGTYICQVSTFPNGNFERRITLTVWILPIASLEPVVLTEGQPFSVAASCRAVGRPQPTLSWDTDLPGLSQNRTNEGGSVSSYYSLHPLRSMNGKRLDCLVQHPALERPRRISNQLVVHYPPDAVISASTDDWFAGLEQATLNCDVGGGFPAPQNITWMRRGETLPDGVSVVGGSLTFERGIRLNDSGLYECVMTNAVGAAKAEYLMTVTEKSHRKETSLSDNLLLIIIGASATTIVVVLVVTVLLVLRRHRHRNKKLKMELSEKKEEISNLSRQASFRRLPSVSSDPRVEDYSLLGSDSRIKNSQISLERPNYNGSMSTLGGRWVPVVGLEADVTGRPVVWLEGGTDSKKEVQRRRAGSYLKSSNMSLDSGLPLSQLPLRDQPDDIVGPREVAVPSQVEDWNPSQLTPPGQLEDEEDGGAYRLSEALTNHFYYSNGVLRPKPHTNGILLHPHGQVI